MSRKSGRVTKAKNGLSEYRRGRGLHQIGWYGSVSGKNTDKNIKKPLNNNAVKVEKPIDNITPVKNSVFMGFVEDLEKVKKYIDNITPLCYPKSNPHHQLIHTGIEHT